MSVQATQDQKSIKFIKQGSRGYEMYLKVITTRPNTKSYLGEKDKRERNRNNREFKHFMTSTPLFFCLKRKASK